MSDGRSMRIGLFGGTFNPVHRCHLMAAQEVCKRIGLDRILFIPTGDPPHKAPSSLASAQSRLDMVRLAISSNPAFDVSDIEIRRQGTSYSIDTVRILREQYGSETGLYFLVGLDAFLEIESWKDAAELIRAIDFIVFSRPGSLFSRMRELPALRHIESHELERLDNCAIDRLSLPLTCRTTLVLLRMPPCQASASEVRRRIRAQQAVGDLLPDMVESYILRHKLYQEGSDRLGIKS